MSLAFPVEIIIIILIFAFLFVVAGPTQNIKGLGRIAFVHPRALPIIFFGLGVSLGVVDSGQTILILSLDEQLTQIVLTAHYTPLKR